MENIASVFVQFGFHQTFLNGLITKNDVPLCIYSGISVYILNPFQFYGLIPKEFFPKEIKGK